MSKGMKIAVSGKGGVGKTTLVAALAKKYQEAGFTVIAVDADPDANLAAALGADPRDAADVTPIAKLRKRLPRGQAPSRDRRVVSSTSTPRLTISPRSIVSMSTASN
ncbi:hypothetical protein LCGC14_3010760 [marine sediment metagenome]|uniref:CobQ/CobB/MinD/ParA nucleotide binding domain-containing protein n=1 Tax=marine sediment metagenome TaxID=412755 RepID=A0A0F8XL24_9ZZZZ